MEEKNFKITLECSKFNIKNTYEFNWLTEADYKRFTYQLNSLAKTYRQLRKLSDNPPKEEVGYKKLKEEKSIYDDQLQAETQS